MNDGIMHSCSSIAGFSLLLCTHILELDHFAIVHGVPFIIQGKKLIYFLHQKYQRDKYPKLKPPSESFPTLPNLEPKENQAELFYYTWYTSK